MWPLLAMALPLVDESPRVAALTLTMKRRLVLEARRAFAWRVAMVSASESEA